MNRIDLNKHIAKVADFPKKGILFFDITPLFTDSDAFFKIVEDWADLLKNVKATKILAMEARGFLFAAPLAIALNLPLVLVRKKGKLPRQTLDETYDLEYGSATISVHKDDISENDSVIIVDDLLATGGTAKAACNLVKKLGAKTALCTFLCQLDFLNGKKTLEGENILTMYTCKDSDFCCNF